MHKSSLFHLGLLIIIVLSAPAQAKNKVQIDEPAPAGPRTDAFAKDTQDLVDLEVGLFTITGDPSAMQGDDLIGRMNIVISNSGPDPIVNGFTVRVYLSDTFGGTTNDTRMGTLFVDGVPVGNTTLFFEEILVPLFTSESDYFLVLKVDYFEDIVETDETDNTSSFPFTVTERPNRTAYYEDFQGGPAGWTPRDLTEQTDIFMNHIDFVDNQGETRGVWWCGDTNSSWADPVGYGNNWNQRLTKSFTLPAGPCNLSYVIQYDTEPAYDFTYVEISNTGFTTYQTLASYDDSTLDQFQFFNHDISSYAGQQVQVRFRFTSDGGWSDEDGDYFSNGAFRLDEVTVTGSPTDDFEVDDGGWIPSAAPPIGGEFRLEEVPYCPDGFDCDNFTNGTSGIFCNAWVAYDPVTFQFPSSSPADHEIGQSVRIVIDSPPIDISDAEPGALFALRFDIFTDLPLENGVFYIWSIRDDLNPTWRNAPFVYWSATDGWFRRWFDISSRVTPGASSMQVRLGATDSGWQFGYETLSHNATPYFDNVELVIFDSVSPTIVDPEPRICGWSDTDTDGDGVLNTLDSCDGEVSSFFDRDGDGCLDPVLSGRHVEYWDDGAFPLVYYIHEAGAPGITDGSDFAAVQAGFNAWTTIPGAEISFSYGGTVPEGDANALDLVNTVTFADPDYVFPAGVLAVGLSTSYVTPVWEGDGFRPGQIIDSDMIFNPSAQFRTATMGTGTSIQSVGTHEAGHMLGVSHSAVQTSTMFYVLPPLDQASDLSPEDIQAMFKSYPDQASVAESNHLRGTVTDGYSGEPVAGAIVFAIEALSGGALGDTLGCDFTLPMDGSYHFLGLPVGDYFLAIHPLNGSSAIGFLQPGNINQMMLTSANTVFLPEFYDAAESNDDLAGERTSLMVGASGTTIAHLITNVDQTPPSVLQTSPADAAVDVAVNSALLIRFSEAMAPDSFLGNFVFKPLSGGASIQGNAALASDDSTLMFVPTGHLAFDTQFQVKILGGVRDLFQNAMGDSVEITFTTEVQPPVFIDNLVPSRAIEGSIVMINGAGFGSDEPGNSVTFDGIAAEISDWTTDQIVVVVPEGLGTDPVTVLVTNPIGSSTATFDILEPEQVARGHEVATIDLPSLPGKVAVSPDGDFAYVTTATGLAVIDITVRDNPVLHSRDVENGLNDLSVAPGGGSIFAVSSNGQKYYRFQFDNTVIPPTVSLLSEIGLGGAPLGILVGPSGRRAYIAVEGGEIQIWDIDESSATFENQIGAFSGVDHNLLGNMAIDPSGDRLFALAGTGNLQIFDLVAAALIGEVQVQSNPVDVTIEPAGQYAYVTDGSGYLTAISLSTLESEPDIPVGGDLRGAAVTPTGSFVYAANYQRDNLDVIDLRPGATYLDIVAHIPARINPVDLVFSPDGVFAYSLVESERKFVVSAMGAGPVLASASPSAGPVGSKVILAGSGFIGANVSVNGVTAVIERATDTAMTIVIPAGASTGPITVVGAVPGEVSNSLTFPVLEAGPAGGLRLAAELQPSGNPDLGPVLAVSPLGGQLAAANAVGDVHLLDTRPGSLTYHQFTTVGGVFSSAVSALAFSPDGATAYAVSSGSQNLVIIDTAFGNSTYGQPLATVPFAGVSPDHLAVSPDGALVLVADPGSAGVWVVDPVGGTASLTTVSQGAVGAMAFHPGGAYAYLAVDAEDPAVLLILDLADPVDPGYGTVTGSAMLPGPAPAEVPVSLAFTPDGTQCYVLTSQMTSTPNRSMVLLDTSDPMAPGAAVTVDSFPTTEPPTMENLVLSPAGDRAVFNISNISGVGLFQASLDPWTAGPLPEYLLPGQEIGIAFGREGGTFFVADPVTDRILTFDFLGVQQLVPVWGVDQTGVVGESLPTPLRIRIVNQDGEGSTGVPVTFTIDPGGGYFSVSGDATEHATLTLATDAFGYAQVDWVLGASPGDQTVQVTSRGVTGSPWTYTAMAIADPELLPLELVSDLLAPAIGAVDVSVTTAIQAVFTKPVDPATIFEGSYFLYDITDGIRVPVVYGFSDLDRRISLTPAAPLGFGKNYQITLTSTIKDLAGEVLVNPVDVVFSTEIPPSVPTLESVSPPSAAAVVGLVLAGTGFDPAPSGIRVLFNPAGGGEAVEGYVSESATDFIRTSVPILAESGTITVESGGQSTNSLPFTVLVPATASADDVIADVGTGSATKSVTVSPDGAIAYAISPEADLMIPIDLGTLASLPGIPVGDEPWALAVHPEGTYVYVANRLSGDVSVIDTDPESSTWHEVVDFVPVGEYPVDLVVSPTGDRVYVANSQSDDLSVIDADESSATFNGVIDNVTIGRSAKSVTVSPDGSRIYIGTEDGYMVLGSLDYGVIGGGGTGRAVKSVTVSPDGTLLVLLDTQGQVVIFDVTPGSGSEDQVIANVGSGSTVKSATVSPDGARLLVVMEVGDIIQVYSLDFRASVSVLDPDATGSITELLLLATLEAGENPQVIAFDPTGTGEFVVANAGDNTMSVFGFVEETGPGLLRGTVIADCPDPGTPLHGVEIDVFVVGSGEMPASLVTNEVGLYEAELEPGSYMVTLVTPLGYTIEIEDQSLEIVSADTTTLDWALACQDIVPSPRRMSFWKHQVGVALRGHGNYEIDGPTLCGYLDIIESSFNNHRLNQVVVYQPPESGECVDKLQVTKDLMNLDGDLDMLSHARQELMALLFNVSSGKLGVSEIISLDGAPVSRAITFMDQLIDDGDPNNDETAMKIAKDINRGRMVNIGVIPDGMPDFSYQTVPRKFSLGQNFPNPFNPKATIKFEVARPEHVKLVIYDVAGRLIKTLVDEPRDPNRYVVIWEGDNDAGARVASGVYFYRMVAGSFVQTYKMMLLK